MSATVAINTAISFLIYTLEDVECKGFQFLRPLIEMLEHYHKQFRNNGDIEYLQKMIDQLNSYQTYKDVMSYMFDLSASIIGDIICYMRRNYIDFLQMTIVRMLELYNYFLDNYVKDYLKFTELQRLIDYLKGSIDKETLMKMIYDDSIVTMIVSILYPYNNEIDNLVSIISGAFSPQPCSMMHINDENKDSDQNDELLVHQSAVSPTQVEVQNEIGNILMMQSETRQDVEHFEKISSPRSSPVIEKSNEESKSDRLKRILGKYGRAKNNERDKSPQKSDIVTF